MGEARAKFTRKSKPPRGHEYPPGCCRLGKGAWGTDSHGDVGGACNDQDDRVGEARAFCQVVCNVIWMAARPKGTDSHVRLRLPRNDRGQSGKSAFSLKAVILLHVTGNRPMPVDPANHEQNTFVELAELAHNGQAKLCGSCGNRPPTGAAATPRRSCNSGMLRMFHKSRKFAIRWMCHRISVPCHLRRSAVNMKDLGAIVP